MAQPSTNESWVEDLRRVSPVKVAAEIVHQLSRMNHDALALPDPSHQHGEERRLGAE